MFEYSGEDLLGVFKELNVQCLHVSENVIKGWFDTDDKNMSDFLTWMCKSLSSKNFASPLEHKEFVELSYPLTGEKLEEEVAALETNYPEIFEVDLNSLDIEVLQDEIELATKEVQRLDALVSLYGELQEPLATECREASERDIRTSLKLSKTEEHCKALAGQLDEVNMKLHKQCLKYAENLSRFEFNLEPNFINNISIESCNESFSGLSSVLRSVIEDPFLSIYSVNEPDQAILAVPQLNETLENDLYNIRNRILNGHQRCIVSNIEKEKALDAFNYLQKTNIASITSMTESVSMQQSMESKEDTKRRMCSVLEKMSEKMADHQISVTRLKYAQQELRVHRSKLDEMSKLEDTLVKILGQYFALSMLYVRERNDISCSNAYFHSVVRYIGEELQNCVVRMKAMSEIIEEYNAQRCDDKFGLIKLIVNSISDESGDFSLGRAVEIFSNFKREVGTLECRLFSRNADHRSLGVKLKENIHILKTFLVGSPTHRIVVVPPRLHRMIQETEEQLKKQVLSVKSAALEMTKSVEKTFQQNKWEKYRRHLWMYFYSEPQKIEFVLHQIEEEFARLKQRCGEEG